MFASPRPIVSQFRLTDNGPLDHEPLRSRRQLTGNDCEVFDVDGGLGLAVASMEMGASPVMDLVVIHPDRDPVEAAYLRHPETIDFRPSQNKTYE